MCTSCGCSGNSVFLQDIDLDTRVVFFDFPHIPGICTAFLHVCCIFIVCVHHADAPAISHFPGTFTQTPELLFSGFLHIPHLLNHGWVNVRGNMLFSFWIFSHQCSCAHHADALEIPHFLRTSIWTPGLFVRCSTHPCDMY